MKKTFSMEHPKIKYPRMIDGTKNEIRKYIKRERRKDLPEGADFWDFDCKFGDTEADAKTVHLKELDGCISDAEKRELTSFYIEILAKEGVRASTIAEQEAQAAAKAEREAQQIVLPKIKGFGEE